MALRTKFPSWAAEIPSQPLTKQELLQLKVEMHDMQMIRLDLQQHFNLESMRPTFTKVDNSTARFRMLATILSSCQKMMDLWEERVEAIYIVEAKMQKMLKMEGVIEEKVNTRLGLENDNAGLRDEITALRDQLDRTRNENNSRNSRIESLTGNSKDEKSQFTDLTKKVTVAQSNNEMLKTVMTAGFAELEDAFSAANTELEEELDNRGIEQNQ